jgi:hypothetical protein
MWSEFSYGAVLLGVTSATANRRDKTIPRNAPKNRPPQETITNIFPSLVLKI